MAKHECRGRYVLGLLSSPLVFVSVALCVVLCLRSPSRAQYGQQITRCSLDSNDGAPRFVVGLLLHGFLAVAGVYPYLTLIPLLIS